MPRVASRVVRRVVTVVCQSCGSTAERYHPATVCNRVVNGREGRQVCRGRVVEVSGGGRAVAGGESPECPNPGRAGETEP